MIQKATILSIPIIVLLILSGCSNNSAEKPNEMADLQGMRGAELTAMVEWKDKLPEETVEYWYNPDTFELIPVSEPKPESFGLGTKGAGGAVKEFEEQSGTNYGYDEKTDYRNKVIHVTVSNNDGALDIKVDWVDAK